MPSRDEALLVLGGDVLLRGALARGRPRGRRRRPSARRARRARGCRRRRRARDEPLRVLLGLLEERGVLGLGVCSALAPEVRELRLDLGEARGELLREGLGAAAILLGLRERLGDLVAAVPKNCGERLPEEVPKEAEERGEVSDLPDDVRDARGTRARRGLPRRGEARASGITRSSGRARATRSRRRSRARPSRARPARRRPRVELRLCAAAAAAAPSRAPSSRSACRFACPRPCARPARRRECLAAGLRQAPVDSASVSFSFSRRRGESVRRRGRRFSRSSRIAPSGLRTNHARRTAYVAQKRTMTRSRERSGKLHVVRRVVACGRDLESGRRNPGAASRPKNARAGALSHSAAGRSNRGPVAGGPFRRSRQAMTEANGDARKGVIQSID